jgi:hypothetical protein
MTGWIAVEDGEGFRMLEDTLETLIQVQWIMQGPGETIVAGYLNGFIGVWDTESGKRVKEMKLSGMPNHWHVEDDVLYVTTIMGDYGKLELDFGSRPYCDLLREVWDEVPVVWENGKAVVADPPEDHPCSVDNH